MSWCSYRQYERTQAIAYEMLRIQNADDPLFEIHGAHSRDWWKCGSAVTIWVNVTRTAGGWSFGPRKPVTFPLSVCVWLEWAEDPMWKQKWLASELQEEYVQPWAQRATEELDCLLPNE